eukprot:10182853-Heterocapsa_arctica.AAC.1
MLRLAEHHRGDDRLNGTFALRAKPRRGTAPRWTSCVLNDLGPVGRFRVHVGVLARGVERCPRRSLVV